jgi:RNA polymerase sigma-70 factor (ECF subfamily)
VSTDPLSHLFRSEAPRLRRFLVRLAGPGLDPDDLLQEVFLVALRKADTFPGGAPPAGWLFGAAVRVVSSHRRGARLRRFLGLDSASHLAGPHTPASLFESGEDSRRVYRVLDQIAEKKRTVFILFELEGLSGEEIARVVGCPLKTVWSRLGHARREFLAGMQRVQKQEQFAEQVERGSSR